METPKSKKKIVFLGLNERQKGFRDFDFFQSFKM